MYQGGWGGKNAAGIGAKADREVAEGEGFTMKQFYPDAPPAEDVELAKIDAEPRDSGSPSPGTSAPEGDHRRARFGLRLPRRK